MGREIRRVPVGWEHPKQEKSVYRRGQYVREHVYIPMFNRPYMPEAIAWDSEWRLWQAGEHPDQIDDRENGTTWTEGETFESWHGHRPTPDHYRPDWPKEEMNGWVVYETVSEGTPVTPVFATPDELIDYLVANGDFWDQQRRASGDSIMQCDPWKRSAAERFVRGCGWSPSLIVDGGNVEAGHRVQFNNTKDEE